MYSIISASKGGYKAVGVYDDAMNDYWKRIRNTADYSIEGFNDIDDILFLFEE